MQTAQEITHASQNQREVTFDAQPPILGTGLLQTIPTPRLEELDLTGQIEPCIRVNGLPRQLGWRSIPKDSP